MDYFDSDNDGLELLLNSPPPKGGEDDEEESVDIDGEVLNVVWWNLFINVSNRGF